MNRMVKQKVVYQGIYLCLMLVFFSEMLLGAKHLSLTSDEPPHIAHGYLMLKTGDTWALTDHRHPPLLNMLAALPLLLQPEQPDPEQVAFWHMDFVLYVRAFWPQLGPIERLAYTTRYANILLSLLLLALLIRWGQEIVHPMGALFSGLMMVIDPTLVAHAQLNTTDIGLTFFAFLTIYLADHTSAKKAIRPVIYCGMALGCAMASKATGLMLVPVVSLILLWHLAEECANRHLPVLACAKRIAGLWFARLTMVAVTSVACVFVIYALPRWIAGNFDLFEGISDHIQLLTLTLSERSRSSFLAGEIRQGGWWWYFPFAFIVKTPIPSIVFLLSTLTVSILQPKKLLERVTLWLFPIIYIVFAARSNLNIGYRHLLPVFPYGYLAVGGFLNNLSGFSLMNHKPILRKQTSLKLMRTGIILLFIWQVVDLVLVFPFPLAYFNTLVGGPANGYRYLVDSNVDWGQSFVALRKYMQSEEIPWTWLSYYTWIDPAVYGITYRPLPPEDKSNNFPRRFNPQPGVYTLSATTLQGIMVADPDMYAWFRQRKPTAQPGYGLLVYNVEPETMNPQWVAQCTLPIAPLSKAEIDNGFGVDSMRIINYTCSEAWIYPKGGTTPGWYIVHGEILSLQNFFTDRFLAYSDLSYQQRAPAQLPPFAIFRQTEHKLQPSLPVHAVFGEDRLVLSGYTLSTPTPRAGDIVEIDTWWSVSSVPSRPLSLMLHVMDENTGTIMVGDGLGVPVTEWQEGDILVQRHSMTLPQNMENVSYNIAVGVYWLDTLERWKVSSQLPNKDNAVTITQIRVDKSSE